MDTATAVVMAIAALVSAVAGYGGVRLANRAQKASARKDEEIERAPYLQQLQDWSQRLMKEEADRRTQDRKEWEDRLARERADCDRRVTRVEVEHERQLRDQEAQWGARLLVAQRREEAWRRFQQGQGGPPP